jgi:hypothetical protein
MTPSGSSEQLRVEDDVLYVEGVVSSRATRLFIEGVLGGERSATGWRIEPRSRSMEELCILIFNWLTNRGHTPVLSGVVDVAVERDLERRRSFQRAKIAAVEDRDGTALMSRDEFVELLSAEGWDHEARDLRDHQIRAAIHGLAAANAANFSVPGAGKTATTLAVAAAQVAAGNVDLVLVIGPLASFQPWETETAIALPGWTVQRLRGSATERRRTIRSATMRSVLLASYPGAVADNAALKELCRRMRVLLVADESHRIKRFNGGQWAPAVIEIAKLATTRMVLSGTPMPQSGLDLFSQLNVLWPGKELTGSKAQFKPRVERGFPQLIASVLPFVSRTSKAELGLTPPVVEFHDVELSADEAEVYTLLRNHLRRAVLAAAPNEIDRLAALRRGRPMRLLQAATNAALLSESQGQHGAGAGSPTLLSRIDRLERENRAPAKFVAAGSIIESLADDEKCVVWSNFVRNLDQFARFAREELGVETFQIDGRVATRSQGLDSLVEVADDDESREAVIANFLQHQGKAILVTNPASCSESISLHQSCRNAIYLDRTYDCAQWLQSIDRIHRLGLPEGAVVRIHVLKALVDGEPTADELVAASLQLKEARMMQLLEGASLQPLQDEPDSAEGTLDDMRSLLAYLVGRDA